MVAFLRTPFAPWHSLQTVNLALNSDPCSDPGYPERVPARRDDDNAESNLYTQENLSRVGVGGGF
jgi:hypothetical protein